MYDQSYESTIYKSNDYYEFFFKNFRGDFIQNYDENIEIETSFKGEKAERGEKCDIFIIILYKISSKVLKKEFIVII